ncbi:heme lyase NrfEFG subunit NrfE [Sphingopyxis lindanitolerans]|uniref:Heme lyase NrfEFG subunit NrfE n=1 Tax=Sphingopyxis lindanitolerans TaxID=2054227 RepID=A0A2S8B6C2_9SPHN|nr:heme lyase CcmF/NrfE family subunit [Sphingopyxis lindanitolerans]PQM27898.1 heme lyase NrfEFG subunit NrfE [Sphingopyxis lindanitolerans]
MIAELGLALLWIAAALACLSLVAGVLYIRTGKDDLAALVRPASVAQGVLTAAAFLLLITLFVRSDMSVELVVRNSHSLKPMLFKVAGAWGNHEGSMLLWLTILGLSGALVAIFEKRLRNDTLIATLAAQAALSLGFFAFLIFSSNPFKRLPIAPPDGQGLNPLLQDPGLAFHPPTLYIGYVGISVAFSFAVGALVTREIGPAFARAMRPWVLGSWIFLTLGITAGSYWAYYELGWGGWWFWDPVENVSLIPWLAGAALLHSVSVTATRNALRAWTVMLAVIAFSMSMVGTFIVRSGLLTSVHSFAVDPERGTFLLALMFIYIGGALTLFAFRAGAVAEGKKFALLSREGSLVINNLLLTTILALVLLGTLYPIVAEAMGEKISVGPPYYNKVAGPLALILCLVMVTGPLLSWRKDDGKKLWSRLPVAVFAAALVLFGLILFGGKVGVLPLLGMTVAGLVGVASLAPLWGRNLRRTPLPTWGMVMAHFGVAVALAGMGAESAFIKERLVAAAPGETVTVADFSVKFAGVKPIAGPNYTAIEGTLVATTPSGASFTLHPAARTFPGLMGGPPTETNEAALLTRPGGQLYVVLGQAVTAPDGSIDRYQLRLWWKPLVWWIWLGGALIAIGATLSLLGRAQLLEIWRARRARKSRERFA